MRIAIMLRALDEKGGIGVYTENLVGSLLEIDTDNEYILIYRNERQLGRFAARSNVREHWVASRSKALWDQFAVPRACRAYAADVVLHPKFTVPLLSSVPSVMVLHGADWFLPDAARFYSPMDRAYMRIFMPLYLRRAAAIISVSKLTTEDFERIFRLPKGKIRTVYFGPAPQFRSITDPATIEAVRHKYHLPEQFIFTLSKPAGGERKNARGILDAYARLHGRVPQKLVIGGQGCERFRNDYSIPSVGWGRDVMFPGWLDQEDLPAVYAASDVFLYPSNQEAFPIPVTEALTCGTPVVTSKANGLEELAGEAALLVDSKDPDAIAEAVYSILTQPALAAHLRDAGLKRSQAFSWQACARHTLQVLEETANNGLTARTPSAGGRG